MDFTELKRFLNHLTSWRMPGNTVSVYLHNKEVFRYSSGYSNLENKTPMTGDELLNLWSCSKISSVTAALQLYEKGKFLLSDPLYEYLPEFKEMLIVHPAGEQVVAKNPITIHDLFRMSAGLSYNTNSVSIRNARAELGDNFTLRDLAKAVANEKLLYEPGTSWNYSLCIDMLGALVEVISGKRFGDYMKENIFEPLEITNVSYQRTPEIKAQMAEQYRYENGNPGDLVDNQFASSAADGYIVNVGKDINWHNLGPNCDMPGSGLVISVPDYAKFASTLANGGLAPNGERILSPGSIELMRSNQLTEDMRKIFHNWSTVNHGYTYGLGVKAMIDRGESGSLGSLGEFNWGGAAGAFTSCDPERKLAYVYAHHMLNPHEDYYAPRLRNIIYACLDK